MRLEIHGLQLHHDVSESFGDLLRGALHDQGGLVCVALGPIYDSDPAEELMRPFSRADVETGWTNRGGDPGVPWHIIERAHELRQAAVDRWSASIVPSGVTQHDLVELDDWARAGLVLEICRRRGVTVRGLGKAHVNWRLKGTQTGRFGASHTAIHSSAFPNGFNPLTIPEAERNLVVPHAGHRLVCVIDFKAIDLCSMVALVPGLARHYSDATDMHGRTAELLGVERDVAKEQIFVHAYGGNSPLKGLLESVLPELSAPRALPHGEFPRMVQALSAKAFRAGLATALPNLIMDSVIPMFTVHDELVLDIDEGAVDRALDVSNDLMNGASQRIGVEYWTSLSLGMNYGDAKAKS